MLEHISLFEIASFVLYISTGISCILVFIFPLLVIFLRNYFHKQKFSSRIDNKLSVAFFHPYCNAGGGGERVLWCAIQALQRKFSDVKIVVYTGDIDASPEKILQKVHKIFDIKLNNVEFIYLHRRTYVEPSKYPYFTLLGQSIGSMYLGYEALNHFIPDVYIDTMGYTFTLPLFSALAGCKCASYIHYPTITSDMIKTISSRQVTYNNSRWIARSPIFSWCKILYYRIFAKLYKFVGKFSDIIMVNSTFTENHINSLLQSQMITYKVYPPCETTDLLSIPLERKNTKKIKIISVAQFRREKNHSLQIRTMYALRELVPEDIWQRVELVIIGATRNNGDEEWLQSMKDLAKHYAVENNVTFKENISYTELKEEFKDGIIGIHTMINEHFGIGIVECMAAGLIMVAHNSGGPLLDIIEQNEVSRSGFLAEDEHDFASCIAEIISLSNERQLQIAEAARSSVQRFSTEQFQVHFLKSIEQLIL